MKILLLTDYYNTYGGIQSYMKAYVSNSSNKFLIIAADYYSEPVNDSSEVLRVQRDLKTILYRGVKNRIFFKLVNEVNKIINSEHIDVVICANGSFPFILLLRLLKIDVKIVFIHGQDILTQKKITKIISRYLLERFTLVLCNSNYTADSLAKQNLISNKVNVIIQHPPFMP